MTPPPPTSPKLLPPGVRLNISDHALAKLAAHAASGTPGVARLHPHLIRKLTHPATHRTSAAAHRADPAAIDLRRDPHSDTVALTVRIVATTDPPVLSVVTSVQHRITTDLHRLAHLTAQVCVLVIDLDTTSTSTDHPDTGAAYCAPDPPPNDPTTSTRM